MIEKKIDIECRLTTHGTQHANAKAIEDLNVPDPDENDGLEAIQEEIKKETDDDDKSGNS